MQQEIIACLDGSPTAEAVLPLAQGIAAPMGAALTLLRIVADADELAVDEGYMRYLARLFGARVKLIIAPDPASAIIEELRKSPRAMPAMTTHGRTAWMEAIVGSVALKVLRGAKRPVLVFRSGSTTSEAPQNIDTIVTALDSSAFSEKVLPFVVELGKSIRAKLLLVQAVPSGLGNQISRLPQTDIVESSYLHSMATEIKKKYGIEPSWDTLHGEPGQATCGFVSGMQKTMLALTSHARGGLERAVLGSVAATCLRHAGVPLLLYRPD